MIEANKMLEPGERRSTSLCNRQAICGLEHGQGKARKHSREKQNGGKFALKPRPRRERALWLQESS